MTTETGKCDPRKPVDLWLSCFDDTAKESRPVFTYRRTNAAEYEELIDGVTPPANATDKELSDWTVNLRRVGIYHLLTIGLVAIKNHVDLATGEPVTDISAESLRKVMNAEEADELLTKRLEGGRLTAAEKKGCESQRCSGTECSATSA